MPCLLINSKRGRQELNSAVSNSDDNSYLKSSRWYLLILSRNYYVDFIMCTKQKRAVFEHAIILAIALLRKLVWRKTIISMQEDPH